MLGFVSKRDTLMIVMFTIKPAPFRDLHNFENPYSQRSDATNSVRISRAALAMSEYPSIWWHQKLESVLAPLYQRPLVERFSAGVL